MELDHFSQIYIYGKHMHCNERCQRQGDKWEHFRCPKQVYYVVKHQRRHHNYRKN